MGYVQFRGTDWGSAFGDGVMKGIAIGNQYRQSKAQYDYQNAIEGADADYSKAMEAAGGDKDKIAAAEKARDAAYNKAIIQNHAYLGNAEKANQAYIDGKESSFLSENWNPPQAMNVSNLAPSSSFASGDGQVAVASNGPTQGVIPASQPQQGMPTTAKGTVAVGKNPVAQAPQQASQAAPQYDTKGAEAYKAELMAGYQKDPTAANNAILKQINADPLRKSRGVSYSLTDSGQYQAFQNGKPMGNPENLPDGLLNSMVGNYFDDEVAARYGTPENPIAAGGVGGVGPTEPARGNGGQTEQPQQGMSIRSDAKSNNEQPAQAQQRQPAQPQQGMNLHPEQIMQQQRPAGYMNAREYMVQREMRMAQLEDAFIKRFGRMPTKLDRNKLAEVLSNEETLWGNVQRENYNNRHLAETSRHNLVSERYKAEEVRERARANDIKELWYAGKLGGTGKTSKTAEKYDLGEPNEDGSIPILGADKLPTGQALSELRVGNDRVAIYHPDGMAKAMVSKVYKEMTDRYGSPWNKGNQTYWIINKDMPPCSFVDATKLVKSERYPGLKEVGKKTSSGKKEEPKADKKEGPKKEDPVLFGQPRRATTAERGVKAVYDAVTAPPRHWKSNEVPKDRKKTATTERAPSRLERAFTH